MLMKRSIKTMTEAEQGGFSRGLAGKIDQGCHCRWRKGASEEAQADGGWSGWERRWQNGLDTVGQALNHVGGGNGGKEGKEIH